MPTVTINVSFHTERHADLLAWLKRQPNRSATIRKACEAMYKRNGDATLDDVLRAIEDLKRSGVVVHGTTDAVGDEPAEAVLALDELGR